MTLCHLSDQAATFRFDDADHPVSLKLKGSYNAQNAAGALTLVRTILQDKLDTPAMLAALAQVEPAFWPRRSSDRQWPALRACPRQEPERFPSEPGIV